MVLTYVRSVFSAFIFGIACCLFGACGNGSSSAAYVNATGRPGEVILVMDKAYLDAPVGQAVYGMLTEDARALTQPEPEFSVSRVITDGFKGFLTYVRNVFIIEIDNSRFTRTSMKYDYDSWAKGQLVVKMTAPMPDSVISYIHKNQESIINLFLRHELFRFADYLCRDYSAEAAKKTDSLFGRRINVPADIRKWKIGKDFLWMSNDAFTKRHDLLIYSFPYRSPSDMQIDRLIEVRDSVLKANIEGGLQGSYPTTQRVALYFRNIIMPGGSRRSEVRGLWEMAGGAMMAGPFVSQAVHDKRSGRIFVAEGFVYNPNEPKRTLIRMMEASLYTFRPAAQKTFNPDFLKQIRYTPYF